MAAQVKGTGKKYYLLGPDNTEYESDTPGLLGGNSRDAIYGRLDCGSALSAIQRGPTYAQHRVFFADEAAAIAAGYRPCGNCMRAQHRIWKAGGSPGAADYPWRVTPQTVRPRTPRRIKRK